VTAGVYLVSISRSRYSAVYGGDHAKTALLHAAISVAAHQICEMVTNEQFRFCHDERSELYYPQCMPQWHPRILYCILWILVLNLVLHIVISI
jgi:hypothetical protein